MVSENKSKLISDEDVKTYGSHHRLERLEPDWKSAFWELACQVLAMSECQDEARRQVYMQKAQSILEICSVTGRLYQIK